MVPIIPISHHFDQQTISKIIAADALVQRYRALFALLDWSPLDSPEPATGPGRPAHPRSAFAKAFLVRVCEKKASVPALRTFLQEHPLLVLELGCASPPGCAAALRLRCATHPTYRALVE